MASAVIGALRAVLGANTAQYEAGMRRAQRTARTTGQSITRDLQAAQRSASRAFAGIAAVAAGFGAASAVRGFARYVDAAKNLEAQLRLATRESGSFAQAQEDVRRISLAARSGIEETAQLYAVFQRNSHELGITQAESARLTETVTKAFQISGATAAEAAGGLRQFLQGIQSGTLRGEELNSVLENAPRLARALADGLGVTIGQLRNMGKEGELTGERVKTALLSASQAIDEEFRLIPVTFDQAMTQVRNAAIVAFGAFDRGGEFSDAIINFAGTANTSFDQIERDAFATGQELRAIFAGLGNIFEPMGVGATNVFDFIRQEAQGLRSGLEEILGVFDRLAAGARLGAQIALQNLGGVPLGTSGRFLPPATSVQRTFRAGQRPWWQDASRFGGNLAQGPQTGDRRTGGGGGESGGSGRRGPSADTLARRAAAEAERAARDEMQYYDEIRQFRVSQLREEQQQTVDAVVRRQIDEQILDIEREQYAAQLEFRQTFDGLAEAKAQQLMLTYDALDVERRQTMGLERAREVDEETRQLTATRADIAMEAMEQESQLARTAGERREIEMRMLDYAYRTERARLLELEHAEGIAETTRLEARAKREALDDWYQRERQILTLRTQGPLETFLDRLPTTAAKANEALQQVAVNGLQSIEDGLLSILDGTKSVGDAFRDMASSIISDLLRIQIQRAITIPLANALGGGGSGLSSILGFLGMASGGKGGSFNPISAVSAFASAGGRLPGFASGGIISIAGRGGIDRNFLSLNGMPVARVSQGEDISIGKRGRLSRDRVMGDLHIHMSGVMSQRQARETGSQLARATQREIARAAKVGMA